MMPIRSLTLTWSCLVVLVTVSVGVCVAEETFTRTEDVIYGRKFGSALTLDVFTPKQNANGAAIIWVISGGWYSNHDQINAGGAIEYLRRGYTVFAVVHGSQPKFTIPEVLEDMHRSVRFIRSRAKEYNIDPDRIGITGASAGGHLSLMQGTAGTAGVKWTQRIRWNNLVQPRAGRGLLLSADGLS